MWAPLSPEWQFWAPRRAWGVDSRSDAAGARHGYEGMIAIPREASAGGASFEIAEI